MQPCDAAIFRVERSRDFCPTSLLTLKANRHFKLFTHLARRPELSVFPQSGSPVPPQKLARQRVDEQIVRSALFKVANDCQPTSTFNRANCDWWPLKGYTCRRTVPHPRNNEVLVPNGPINRERVWHIENDFCYWGEKGCGPPTSRKNLVRWRPLICSVWEAVVMTRSPT